jgi:fatty acid desaturase
MPTNIEASMEQTDPAALFHRSKRLRVWSSGIALAAAIVLLSLRLFVAPVPLWHLLVIILAVLAAAVSFVLQARF